MKKKSIFENNILFIFFAVICTALWGTAFPGVKLGYEWFDIGSDDTGSKLMFAGVRFALAGLIVLVVYIIKNRRFPLFSKKDSPAILALSAVQITGNYFFYYPDREPGNGTIDSMLEFFKAHSKVNS